MVIRSYKRVFSLDRRIYAFGDWQLPVPNGIPLRGLGYAIVALLLSLALWLSPGTGLLFGVFPWPFRHVLLPVWIAALGMRFDPDGRRADLFVLSWLQFVGRRVRTRVRRPSMDWSGKLKVRWDASDVVLHRGGRVHGPATAAFRVPVELNDRWDGWYAEASPDGQALPVQVRADQTLKVRP